jgi:ABC-type nitrate/sulfonate/bicarbonate transport system substrate-binding protein
MKMNKYIIIAIIAAVTVVLGAAFVLWPRAPKGYSGKTESITIGSPLNESSALIYIAEDQHFFTGNGLNVTVRDYDFGALALNGMLRGEADIALATEFPLVVKAFQKEKVLTIGSIGKFEFVYLIGRKDRGIEKISDLKGKKVGTARQTIAEFYLGRYLNLHGMNFEEITFVDVQKSGQGADAIVNGDIDAIVAQQPRVTSIESVWAPMASSGRCRAARQSSHP